ncbi:MAG: gamma-glutamylcyclotransferase family protein [Phormidesmis sp.]
MDMSESDSAELRVFVYGTLQPGGRYHQRYCGYLSEAVPAMVKGRLYDFPALGYPAMTAGEDWVKGYLLRFCQSAAICEQVLRGLDWLEGYERDRPASQNNYQRCQKQIFDTDYRPLPSAWAYEMDMVNVRRYGGVYLPGGQWPCPRRKTQEENL